MNKQTLRGHSFQRLMAFFLCVLLLIGLLPVSAFAATRAMRQVPLTVIQSSALTERHILLLSVIIR